MVVGIGKWMHGRRIHRAAALCLITAAGCGDITLVPAPFTPNYVDLEYSATEDLTRLRWQLARNNDALRFELLAGAQTIPIDLATAPFAAGAYPCGDDATCFQWTRRGAVPAPVRIVASHPQYGRFPSLEAPLHQPADALRAWFTSHAAELAECTVPGAEPRPPRRLLLTIHLDRDGAVKTLELAGGRELAREELSCVRARVSQLRFPLAELHGRETVVVSVVL